MSKSEKEGMLVYVVDFFVLWQDFLCFKSLNLN